MLDELILELKQKDVHLYLQDGKLRCKAPPSILNSELKSTLQNYRAELTSYLSEVQQHNQKSYPIHAISRNSYCPLSFAQQRLWTLAQFNPCSVAYNIPSALRLIGHLDIGILERSLNEIVCRHEVLRTTFDMHDGQPVQVIAPVLELDIAVADLSQLSGDQRKNEVDRYLREKACRSFDLATGPLVRAMLLSLGISVSSGHAEHVLLFSMHHIISDGWSTGVLVREFVALYEAFRAGQSSPLPELTIQYADYAAWQREWLQDERLIQQLDYWKQQLAGTPAVLELPTDRSRPAVQSYQGADYRFTISKNITAQLNALSQQQGVTLFMTLLTAFNILLSRYSNQHDICVGTPVANRNRIEIEGLIGFFVNTLILRTDLSGNPAFTQLLKKVKAVCLDAQVHQDLPFEKLVEELVPVRDMSRNPLFQVMFALQNVPEAQLAIDGLQIIPVEMDTSSAKFDLHLEITERQESLEALFNYNTDLFNESTIIRMAGHFQRLLEGIVSSPDKCLADLPLLPDVERNQLLEWNATEAVYPQNYCLHQLFEAQVEKSPDAIAVVFEDQQLTYEQLNAKANQLAYYLRTRGIGPEVLVGICVERSLEMVIGILAILKAGGAYVPIDPSYPRERIAFMLEDAQPVVSLIHTATREILPENISAVDMDEQWQAIAQFSEDKPSNLSQVQNLAYVIYTSGSTGKPKGALATHLNVLRLFSNTQSEFAFSNKDVWTLFHSSAFDFSVWELWGALIFGGKLVVVPYWVSRSPEEFYRLLCEQAVTVLNQTPSAFRSLIHKAVLAHDDGKQRHALRLVIFGGEALELRSLKPWFEHFGYDQPQLVNMYGITETTVHVTRCPIYQDTFQKISGSPIGQPVEDLQTYVLDRHLNLQPIGVPSELYIGGAGLVRGYLSRPGLTAERFVPNPFSKQPGGRLYRTGDLARYRADGNIEYLGRTDHQVKIRGFRIELGEIEAALLQHEGVEEAVVLVREDSLEDRRLVAYIAGNESVPDIETIRTHLKVSLPDYMVPSAFVFLDHFPLTPNGKLDRTALPAPDIDHQLTREYVAPRNPTEAILAEIWAEVLGVEKVGIHDNFFELGGHSIRSIQIVSLAREKGLIFSIEQLYRSRTIHELSQIVEGFTQSNSVASALDPFEMITWEDQVKLPEDIENAYPLSSLQAGMIFHSQSDPNAYHIFDSITLHCVFNQHCLEEAISYILRQHPILRTTFDFKNFSEPLQLVHKQPVVYIKYIDLRHFDSTQQLNMLLEWEEVERVSYFEIDQLPLIRFRIHQLADDRFQFSITEHHAVLDGWSLVTMLNEIFLHYFALLEAKPWGQIAGFDNAMYRLLSYEKDALNSDRYKDYLTQYLSGFEVDYLPELITDTGQDQYDWHPGLKIVLPQKLTQKLRDLADLLAVPLKSVLLAAHIRVVSLLSGKTNVTSGLVCNTRPEELGSEYVLGVFLNTLPFYQKLKNGNWQEFITQIFDTECKLLRVRYYPLAAIQRMYGGKPLFDTLFNYVHYHVGKPLLASNKLEIIDWQDDAQPNFSLEVGFNLDTLSSDIQLRLRGNKLNPGQLERIQSYFMAVLTEIADKPTTHIATHSFLSSFERHQLLVDWNATEAVYSQHYCLHQLFEARVEQNPEDVAVVFKNQQLTYEQLNAKANQLAHYLRAQGVGPEVLVGICIERSLEMVIGILGILKAGGAYLPIDPGYPRERIAFVLEDAQPVLSLIHTATREVLPEDIFVVDMDAQRQAIAQCSEDNPFSLSQVQNLAYVIYTSGSTGRPKGAGLAHQGVVNRLQWMQQQYQLNASDRVLQKTPFGFDVSVWEFFWPLLTGARLVVAQPEVHKDAMRIAQMIQDHEITIVHFVPSMLSAFLDIADVTICRSLRYVICSGEALSTSLQQKFFEKLPAQLHNLYGPTEASIDVTMWACEPDSKESVVPIGSPIANTQIYLLDAYLNLVPIGVPGELYIGGVGLARGYQNCAALTAERFIPNSFSRQPGERLYRTGDLARYRVDGNIEYLGRTDHQVKIRGFRIELGEIEAALLGHEGIKEAVVIVREDNPEDKRLVAYIIGNESVPDIETIRIHLKTSLPDYMVPSAFVFLDHFPLTPNGKLDRTALPAPDIDHQLTREYVAPRNPTEAILAEIWAEVLGVEKVGIHDNFFELGGHSLLVMQIMTKVRMTFDVDMPLATLFKVPTVGNLAQLIEEIITAEIEGLSEAEAEHIALAALIDRK